MDKDQGFSIGKKAEKRTDRSRIIQSKLTYGKALSKTPPRRSNVSDISPLSQSRNIMTEIEASHLMNRMFKNDEMLPNMLFKDA